MTKQFLGAKLLAALRKRRPQPEPLASPRLAAKLFAADEKIDPAKIREIFHRWIREGSLANEQPIDVVSYAHLPFGPWTLLVCTTGQYSLDARERPGLRFARRERAVGAADAHLRRTFGSLAAAAELLERDAELSFVKDELELAIDDRLRAPNSDETFAALERDLPRYLSSALPRFALINAGRGDAKGASRVTLRFERPFGLGDLLAYSASTRRT